MNLNEILQKSKLLFLFYFSSSHVYFIYSIIFQLYYFILFFHFVSIYYIVLYSVLFYLFFFFHLNFT